MSIELIIFYVLAIVAVGSAVLVVSMRNIARSLFLFFVVLFAVAGLYVYALADFVAVTQIMVYVGGVLVLMIFAFMLSNKQLMSELHPGINHFFALPRWQALFISAAFLAVLIYSSLLVGEHEPAWITASREGDTAIKPTDNTIRHLGLHLMTRFLLPFEVVSILLMMALIGAAHLARKEANA